MTIALLACCAIINTHMASHQTVINARRREADQMSMRFKLAALASATLLAASVGIGLAAPAFAANNQEMYVDTNNNAYFAYVSSDSTGTYVQATDDNGITKWDVPTSSGEISTYSTSPHLCMSVDTSNNRIHLETCNSNVDEEWTAHLDGDGYWFFNAASNDCLNAHWQVSELNVASCNQGANQIFIL